MEYYTFEIEGEKVGYYEHQNLDGILYSCAYFKMDGHQIVNAFWIKHEDGKVLAIKTGDGEYVEFNQAEDVYPSSAINLIIPLAQPGNPFAYKQYNEGSGEIVGDGLLKRAANRIQETVNGKIARHFILDGEKIIEYCWGVRTFSKAVMSEREAKAGTDWE